MNRCDGRVALVTGAAGGIGSATARLLAQAGAIVVATDLREDAGHALVTSIVAAGGRAVFHRHDVALDADWAGIVSATLGAFGQLDVLVNNAGISELAPLGDAALDHVRRLFDINVLGLIETTRLALPLLEKSKGNIVNIASTVADHPFANMSAYSATKAAVVALTKAWAKELAPKGVRVNAVSPGPIETPIFSPEKLKISQEQIDAFGASVAQLVPLARFGKAEEVAEVVGFLSSSAASYVTGAQYSVGGGFEAS